MDPLDDPIAYLVSQTVAAMSFEAGESVSLVAGGEVDSGLRYGVIRVGMRTCLVAAHCDPPREGATFRWLSAPPIGDAGRLVRAVEAALLSDPVGDPPFSAELMWQLLWADRG